MYCCKNILVPVIKLVKTHLSKLKFWIKNLYCICVMSFSFYTFIVILIVQVIANVNMTESNRETLRNVAFLPKHKIIVKREAINKRFPFATNEARPFNSIHEKFHDVSKPNNVSPTLREIKIVLKQLLNKLDALDTTSHTQFRFPSTQNVISMMKETTKPDIIYGYKKRNGPVNGMTRWADWTNWSSCSVSCGKGRKIRWRHCLMDCDIAETEMEEKSCQLPACAPQKFFGIKL